MSKFALGEKVYIRHPQSEMRPFTIIDAKIIGVVKVIRFYTHYDYYVCTLNEENVKYEYRVELSPSGSKIEVEEEEIFSDLTLLKEKLNKDLEEERVRLQKKINSLCVVVDI